MLDNNYGVLIPEKHSNFTVFVVLVALLVAFTQAVFIIHLIFGVVGMDQEPHSLVRMVICVHGFDSVGGSDGKIEEIYKVILLDFDGIVERNTNDSV